MKNTDYIKKNYKSSTIARLRDFGYDTLESINIDPDMTYALKVCKDTGKENQDTLFSIINEIQKEFNDFMDNQYPNGLFSKK